MSVAESNLVPEPLSRVLPSIMKPIIIKTTLTESNWFKP